MIRVALVGLAITLTIAGCSDEGVSKQDDRVQHADSSKQDPQASGNTKDDDKQKSPTSPKKKPIVKARFLYDQTMDKWLRGEQATEPIDLLSRPTLYWNARLLEYKVVSFRQLKPDTPRHFLVVTTVKLESTGGQPIERSIHHQVFYSEEDQRWVILADQSRQTP